MNVLLSGNESLKVEAQSGSQLLWEVENRSVTNQTETGFDRKPANMAELNSIMILGVCFEGSCDRPFNSLREMYVTGEYSYNSTPAMQLV
ncbi:hypothetical protein LINPERHAP1_LOCUS40637 [Linum perenne]